MKLASKNIVVDVLSNQLNPQARKVAEIILDMCSRPQAYADYLEYTGAWPKAKLPFTGFPFLKRLTMSRSLARNGDPAAALKKDLEAAKAEFVRMEKTIESTTPLVLSTHLDTNGDLVVSIGRSYFKDNGQACCIYASERGTLEFITENSNGRPFGRDTARLITLGKIPAAHLTYPGEPNMAPETLLSMQRLQLAELLAALAQFITFVKQSRPGLRLTDWVTIDVDTGRLGNGTIEDRVAVYMSHLNSYPNRQSELDAVRTELELLGVTFDPEPLPD